MNEVKIKDKIEEKKRVKREMAKKVFIEKTAAPPWAGEAKNNIGIFAKWLPMLHPLHSSLP